MAKHLPDHLRHDYHKKRKRNRFATVILGLIIIIFLGLFLSLFSPVQEDVAQPSRQQPSQPEVVQATPPPVFTVEESPETPVTVVLESIEGCAEQPINMWESMCTALVTEDVVVCNDLIDEERQASCIRDYAFWQGLVDVRACDLLEGDNAFCLAMGSKDCSSLSGSLAVACNAYIAEDISGCGEDLECRSGVATALAIVTGEASYCEQAVNTQDNPIRDLCYALVNKDESICHAQKIADCSGVILNNPNLFRGLEDVTECEKIADPNHRQRCIAVASNDRELCGLISQSEVLTLCEEDVDGTNVNVLLEERYPECRTEECGDLIYVDCNSAADGPAYYLDAQGNEIARCGGYCQGPDNREECIANCPPAEWSCS